MFKKILIILFFVCILPKVSFCEEEKWQQQNSAHFIIYYKEAPEDFIGEVVDAAEDYYQKITRDLGFTRYEYWMWEDRAKIYIYKDSEDYHSASGKPSWASGHAEYEKKIIYTYPLAWGFFDTLLPHELGHIIFREFVGFKNNNVPLWLDEGVACYQERTRRWGSEKEVRKSIEEKKFIPLLELTEIKSLSDFDDAKVELFYNESVSAVSFLVNNYGKYNFVRFCKELKDNNSLDKAIDSAYGRFDNLKELNDVWYKYLTTNE